MEVPLGELLSVDESPGAATPGAAVKRCNIAVADERRSEAVDRLNPYG